MQLYMLASVTFVPDFLSWETHMKHPRLRIQQCYYHKQHYTHLSPLKWKGVTLSRIVL